MRPRDELIRELLAAPAPAAYRSPAALAALWLAGAWIFVVAATRLAAPLRPGWAEQLAGSPHFAAESLLGLAAGLVSIGCGMLLGFPKRRAAWKRALPALVLLAVWGAAYLLALWHPAIAPSMLGKRPFCVFEVMLYGIPPMLAGLLLLRNKAAVARLWTGALVGAAAGAIPGLLMQVACMYLPSHILGFHIAPIAVVAALGAALGPVLLRRV